MTHKCTSLKCETFAKIALRPIRGIKKGETLPPPTIEQTNVVDTIVVNCPYRQKDMTCTNQKEKFHEVTYP